jgi:EPS-associated MarR family transcriptional regulator
MTEPVETTWYLLKALQEHPQTSQRELAETLGVSLGKLNYCLKALIEKGWVKVGNFSRNANKKGYVYLLTPRGISRILSALRIFLMKIIFAFPSKQLLTVSEFSKYQILNSWGLSSDKVSVIHNFGGHNTRIKENKCGDEKIYILTFGHVTYYKNPLIWIKVAENVINCLQGKHIEFIWGGDGDLLEQCRKIVAATGSHEHIKFIGYTSDVDFYHVMASLYFQPSTIESHGISVVEAMSYSPPCVVSNVGGLPESVEYGINGFLSPPDDIDAMSKAIIKIIGNNSLRQEMGQQSLRIFNEKFSYSIWRQKMDELYTNRIFGNAR